MSARGCVNTLGRALTTELWAARQRSGPAAARTRADVDVRRAHVTEAGAERDQPPDSPDLKLKGGEVKREEVGAAASWAKGADKEGGRGHPRACWGALWVSGDADVAPRGAAHPQEPTGCV